MLTFEGERVKQPLITSLLFWQLTCRHSKHGRHLCSAALSPHVKLMAMSSQGGADGLRR